MNYQNNTQLQGAPVPSTKEVPTKAGDLRGSLDNLNSLVSTLGERLGCVMRTSAPEPDSNVKAVEAQVCEIADAFYQSQKSVDSIASRLLSFLNRLEI